MAEQSMRRISSMDILVDAKIKKLCHNHEYRVRNPFFLLMTHSVHKSIYH